MNVSVIIPVWNGRTYLEVLLNSLEKQTLQATEVIVVDNGSGDGAGDLAARWGAKVVRFAENRGFAVAVNRGVAESSGEVLSILNSDVELDLDWTERLAQALHREEAWFASGLVVSASNPDRIDGAWDLVSKAGMPWRVGSGFPVSAFFQLDRPIQISSFTAVLIKRELWNQVGDLDERFESYLEDVDWGLRCVQAGRRGYYVGSARCRHQGSATLGRWYPDSVRRMSRNQLFLTRKHFGADNRRWNVFVGQLLWGAVVAKHGGTVAWLQGKWEGWRRRQEFLPAHVPAVEFDNQEREIFATQAQYGLDSYWRWYGWLTGALRPFDTAQRHD